MNRIAPRARWLAGFVALSVRATALAAQDASTLAARVDKPTYVAVSAIVDSARIAKLPTKPLYDKALEGAAKGFHGPTIVVAVQQLSVRLASAKRGLGTATTPDEIRAAAIALEAGVSVPYLARLRAVAGKRPLTVPLSVLTDLIARSVPVPTATDLVMQLARTGVRDTDLALYQRNVRADIDRGADPTVAATTRARGLVARPGAATKPAQ